MIESIILTALGAATSVNAYMEIPEQPEDSYLVVQRTGGAQRGSQKRTAVLQYSLTQKHFMMPLL